MEQYNDGKQAKSLIRVLVSGIITVIALGWILSLCTQWWHFLLLIVAFASPFLFAVLYEKWSNKLTCTLVKIIVFDRCSSERVF